VRLVTPAAIPFMKEMIPPPAFEALPRTQRVEMKTSKAKKRIAGRRLDPLRKVHRHAAGIDTGATQHFVALNAELDLPRPPDHPWPSIFSRGGSVAPFLNNAVSRSAPGEADHHR